MRRSQGSNPPRVSHSYQNHPSTIQTMEILLALMHRDSKLDCPNGIAERDGVHSRYAWGLITYLRFTITDTHNLKYGIKPQAYQHTFGVSQHKIMLFGNI